MGTTSLKHTEFLDGLLTAMESASDEDAVQYGKLGMRWGVKTNPDGTKSGTPRSEVTVKTTPGKKVKTSGGRERPAHEDAIKARVGQQIAKKSSTDALSNQELQAVVQRMQLEANYQKLSAQNVSAGRAFINTFIGKNPKAIEGNVKAASQIRSEILKVKDDKKARADAAAE